MKVESDRQVSADGPRDADRAVRERHRFDADRLDAWLAREVEGYAGPLRVEQFKGGQSNPTYKLVTPGRDYVLRRKPPGPLLPGAHAVDREHRVAGLQRRGQQAATDHPGGIQHDHGAAVSRLWDYPGHGIFSPAFGTMTLPEGVDST